MCDVPNHFVSSYNIIYILKILYNKNHIKLVTHVLGCFFKPKNLIFIASGHWFN